MEKNSCCFLTLTLIGSLLLNGSYWLNGSKQNAYTSLPTKTPLLNDFPFSGKASNDDNLLRTGDTTHDTSWDGGLSPDREEHCILESDGYHVKFATIMSCLSHSIHVTNFALQVDVKILNRGYAAGVAFRWQGSSSPYTFYLFYVRTDGTYGLDVERGNIPYHPLIPDESIPHLQQGNYQSYRLGIIAFGNIIDLYINGQHLGLPPTAIDNDSTSQQGKIGFDAGSSNSTETEAVFSNLKIWDNIQYVVMQR